MSTTPITISLLYIDEQAQWHKTITLAAGSTVADALVHSHAHTECPQTEGLPFGVFGEEVSGQRVLNDGDRIEFYRPLRFDPMDSRRRRAEHRARNLADKQGKKLNAAALMLANQSRKK